jgi:hypothetical protein
MIRKIVKVLDYKIIVAYTVYRTKNNNVSQSFQFKKFCNSV